MLGLWVVFLFAFPCCIVAYLTFLPKSFPRNIPVAALWPQIYDTIRGLSRVDSYNRRIRPLIEKHGAVAFWRHGQWTVLVTKPAYLVQIFKKTDRTLSKAGHFHRRPGSTNARLFGENIFNCREDLHSTFSKILRPGILRPAPIASMKAKTQQLAMRLLRDQTSEHGGVGTCIRTAVWTWSISLYGEYFLDTELDSLEFTRSSVQQILRTLNCSVIGRFEFLFPLLRHLPWKPHILQRTGSQLRQLELDLLHEVEQRRKMPPSPYSADKVIYLLGRAKDETEISEFHYRSNHKQLFVAGHENVEAVLVSAMLQLAKHQDIQSRLRSAVTQEFPANYSVEDLDRLPLLLAVIYETLRLYPPLWTLTNRRSSEPFILEPDIIIPPNTLVGWHAYGIHTDPLEWGESAGQFNPLRWGANCAAINRTVRAKQTHGAYIPFGMHSRRCLGSGYALTLLKVALCELLRTIEWSLPSEYKMSFSNTPVMRPDDCGFVVRKTMC
ncbi:cytochrome P450 [Pochonia chlamydosporia 170]|uniref:Cytochrome P450 n=1 Tax=Pochonia chlamydosporia 170 TaxID=1380566 RepID=A0A179FI44_METCM|nr:cytochrome P450 [Pochonia chlamydosporia 170]OAQ64950.2 cytochrome P450 [Pochonia chlamydosporia 170]